MKALAYKINTPDFLVSHSALGFPNVFRDSFDKISRQAIRNYFDRGYDMLLMRLESLRELDRPVTEYERKELLFMLQALLDAKDMLEGE